MQSPGVLWQRDVNAAAINNSLRGKLLGGFGAIVVMAMCAAFVGWQYTSALASEFQRFYEDQVEASVYLANAHDALWELRYATPNFMIGSATSRARILADETKWPALMDENIRAYAAGHRTPEERQLIDEWDRIFAAYIPDRPRFFELYGSGQIDEATEYRAKYMTPRGAESVRVLGDLVALQRRIGAEQQQQAAHMAALANAMMLALLLTCATVGSAIAVLMSAGIARAVRRVGTGSGVIASRDLPSFVRAARALADGDPTQTVTVEAKRVPVGSSDEVGQMADDFNRMIDGLHETRGALEEMRVVLQARSEALEHQALHDSLTGLPNRVLLRSRLERELESRGQSNQHVALLLLDLDRFKEVNDSLGHQAGDELLRIVASCLAKQLRPGDTIARLGGDEFAVLLPGADADGANYVGEKLMAALIRPFHVAGQQVSVGSSIGIATTESPNADATVLLRNADIAMYAAKRSGGGCVTYTAEHDQHRRGRLALGTELRSAIENDQLVLHFQPLGRVASDEIACAEALVRWRHPERGLLPPDAFVSVAEQNGLIGALDRWVLRSALQTCRAWQLDGLDLPVTVNVSATTIHDLNLSDYVAAELANCDLSPRMLTVEVTETAVLVDPEAARLVLTRLRTLGVRVAIDDFGAGNAGFGYLRNLPADQLKIDRDLVKDMAHDRRDAAIVRATIDLAQSLELECVAEGIENRVTWDLLASLGCELAQGYYLARPAPAAELRAWMAQRDGLNQPAAA